MELKQVLRICRRYESDAQGITLPRDSLDRLPLPSVLLVNENRHCMVIEDLDLSRQRAMVWDPSDLNGKAIPLAALRSSWSGRAIVFGRIRWPWNTFLLVQAGIFAGCLALWVRSTCPQTQSRTNCQARPQLERFESQVKS